MPAPEDSVAAGLADRVQVPVPGAPLGAEGGVGVLAAGAASGWMVVKASGCAGQGILILAWLETRDHFNPFALRASEDFPVDVDRPT